MEEKLRSTKVHGLYYGLPTGAGLVVLSLILFLIDQLMNRWLSSISYLILIVGMVYGAYEYRRLFMKGYITYGEAFSACLWIGLIASLVASVYTFIFAQFIDPAFVQQILDQSREKMIAQNPNMTEEQIEVGMTWAARFTSPVMMMIFGFIVNAVISVVIGLIAAIFLKKEDPSLNSTI